MLLKRLELMGFKSFADKTVLDFTEGSTAVVGPNGSGKSNISDAIRWVIGEVSAKQLRGANMQDVIFAGTDERRPVNYAEVSLVLDNRGRLFNIEFDEVVVTRRLFRSGESIYQINRANCRLKDIHELFMDTGLGRDGYSIIGQGNVSQILSTKAEDRRSLFEEAAGVSKYKYRREEAERKLRGVDENLVRIGDIISELEAQRAPLKRQSEKARQYLGLYEEYKGLDVNMSLITIEKNKQQTEKSEALLKNVRDELETLRVTESETESRISGLYDDSKKQDEKIAEQNTLLLENESEAMAAKNEISIAENNIRNNNTILERIKNDTASIREKNKERGERIAKCESDIKKKEAEAQAILVEFDSAQSAQAEISERQERIFSEIEGLKGDAVEKLNEIASKKAQMSGIETLRQSFLERRTVVEKEISSFKENISDTKQNIESCSEEIGQKSDKLKKMKSTVDTLSANMETLKKEYDDLSKKLSAANVEYDSKSSKKKILEGMENDYAGFSKSVKAVLKSDSLKHLAIYGTVSGLIEADKKYVTAIESTLGGAMQNIVVEREEDAKEAIEYLRRNGAGRATFLPVSSVKGRELDNFKEINACEGVIGPANTLVRYDKKYDGVIKSLLGGVVVVDNMDNAISLCRKFGYKFRAVTLEGDILNAGGSMSGGSVNKQSGFLSRAAEIKSLTSDLRSLSDTMRDIEKSRKIAEEDIKRVDNQLSSYIPLVREYEDEILRLEATKAHLEESLDAGGETQKGYENELLGIEKQLAESSDEIAMLLSFIRALENDAAELQTRTEQLTEEHETIIAEREEKSQSIMEKTMTLGALQKDINVIRNAAEIAEIELRESLDAIKNNDDECERIRVENDTLYKQINDKNVLTEEIKAKSQGISDKIREIEERKQSITDTLKEIQNSNKDLTDKLLNLQQEISRLENRIEKLTSENESILSRLWDNYELTISTAEEIRTEVEDVKASSERLSELKNLIKALGNINVDSIEEYVAVEERFKFLAEQKNDLEKSKKDLLEIISSMEELMEEHFEKQFAEINKSFGEVFKELFGGGRGRLYLSQPDDILESGIEIEVQLPGKGLQNINLYSGGEKSFIAIALLFAILKVKPAPFCILDEIDAALDDVNVARFATYLKNYTEQTQFIVITHRRGTMEATNILYGVTMQEKGVSKLLSLHIDDVSEDMAS